MEVVRTVVAVLKREAAVVMTMVCVSSHCHGSNVVQRS